MSKELQQISQASRAIAVAKTPDVANEIRARLQAIKGYLRKAGRTGVAFENAFEAARLECEAAARAGELWARISAGSGRPEKATTVVFSVSEAGFAHTNDAVRCVRISELSSSERSEYYEKCRDGLNFPSINGLEMLWFARQGDIASPSGKFDVVVVDPPWPVEKIEREVRPNQDKGVDYPTWPIDKIAAEGVPAADDCHVFLWTTQRFLAPAIDILAAWGARYVCTFVWHKPGGFQPVGLPQYNCEFVLYGRKGSPKFTSTKGLKTCFNAPRGAHSEKPDEFYEMIRGATSGKRLDMFARKHHAGYKAWGNEAPKQGAS